MKNFVLVLVIVISAMFIFSCSEDKKTVTGPSYSDKIQKCTLTPNSLFPMVFDSNEWIYKGIIESEDNPNKFDTIITTMKIVDSGIKTWKDDNFLQSMVTCKVESEHIYLNFMLSNYFGEIGDSLFIGDLDDNNYQIIVRNLFDKKKLTYKKSVVHNNIKFDDVYEYVMIDDDVSGGKPYIIQFAKGVGVVYVVDHGFVTGGKKQTYYLIENKVK